MSTPAVIRVLERVLVNEVTGCWEYQGARQALGHGLVRVGSRTDSSDHLEKAHRVVYAHFVGPIPEGLALDHVVCANPPCVNYRHLEAVTRGENSRRARLARTECNHGHVLAEVGFVQLDAGRRMCAVCYRVLRARQNEKRRARRAAGLEAMR